MNVWFYHQSVHLAFGTHFVIHFNIVFLKFVLAVINFS